MQTHCEMCCATNYPKMFQFQNPTYTHGFSCYLGSNTGLGFETAKDLAARGARVVMVCRNMQKADLAKSKIIGKLFIKSKIELM